MTESNDPIADALDSLDWDRLIPTQGGGGSSYGYPEDLPDPRSLPEYSIPNPWDLAAVAFEPKPDYYSSLEAWCEYKLQEKLWSKQREIADSIQNNRYTAVPSCHDAGKSYIVSRAIGNWIDKHELGDAFVVSTAPTAAQVAAILWRELLRAHTKGKLPGRITTAGYPQWKLNNQELVGYGRKPADYSQSAFQGIHSQYPLIVIDEANGVDANLFNSVDALATNKNARVVAIGNPDDPSSHFAKICKPDSGWNVIRIDGLRTPNMTREQIELLPSECHACKQQGRETSLLQDLMEQEQIPYSEEPISERLSNALLSPLWVEERLHRWVGAPSGETTISIAASQSSLFTSKVRGLFPDSNSEGVIPLGWIERAIARWMDWDEGGRRLPGDPRLVIGADIARTGDDSTVLARRKGPAILDLSSYRYADTMETTGHIAALLGSEVFAQAVVDSIGVGAGVLDRLRELGYSPIGFTASATAKGLKDRSREFSFLNLRAAAWWNLRELLDPSRHSVLMLPPSDALKEDLCAPRWKVRSGGVIQIEAKDDIKKRLGRSTDNADAVVQAFWVDSAAAEFYTKISDAVPWVAAGDEESVMRWVQPDAVEQWLDNKRQEENDQWR